jgi:hypothetical protein
MKTAIKYPYYWLVLIVCVGLTANAQKLPNIQPTGLYTMADVKIDGKANDWNNQFQAYNKSTSLYYTIANNADNLYLVFQSTDKTAIQKMLSGGITLIINNAINISTPITSSPNRANIVKELRSAEPISTNVLDVLNKELATNFKEIKLNGISSIPDSIISVYNNYGIKVAGALDLNKAYTCEMAIPLKYISGNNTVNYNIRLNGLKYTYTDSNGRPLDTSSLISAGGPAVPGGPTASGSAIQTSNTSTVLELINATDFSGTYILVK